MKNIFSLKSLSSRFSIFAVIPLSVLAAYAYIFGMGEVLVHTLAIGQYTLLAFIAYAISNALSSGVSSTDAFERTLQNDSSKAKVAAIVFTAIIVSRIIAFFALAMSYTMFMTSSKSLM